MKGTIMKSYTAKTIAKYLAEEIPAMPLGGYLKDQNVDLDGNQITVELSQGYGSDVPREYQGKRFKIVVVEC